MFKMDDELNEWLKRNRYGTYNGVEFTPETEMVAYTYVISILVMTFRRSTRYYFKEAEKGKAIIAKILCILCNLTVGWWGIPWGPIWTIKETFCDLFNMHKAPWGQFAGSPVDVSESFNEEQKVQEQGVKKEQPSKNNKVKDILIYVAIGAVIAIALIVADMNGML